MQSMIEGIKSSGLASSHRFASLVFPLVLQTAWAALALLFLMAGAAVRLSAAAESPDCYAAFRGTFELGRDSEVEFRLLGAAWFVAWLDGEYFAEGPARFSVAFPQYQTYRATLKAGRHVLAVQVHHHGVPTRALENQQPFLHAEARVAGRELPV